MRKPEDMAVLTEDQVRAIHKDKRSALKISVEYGVSRQSVYNIKLGATWKHLKLKPTRKVPPKVKKPLEPPIENRQVKTSDPKEKQHGSQQFNGFFDESDDIHDYSG